MSYRSSLLLSLLVGSLLHCGGPSNSATLEVPAAIAAPAGQRVSATLAARGVQIYQCEAHGDTFVWKLEAPDAVLYDAAGAEIGTHSAGPTWAAADGSQVVGRLAESVPAPGADDIPWLLVTIASNAGAGRFGNVKTIQRVRTVGGKAPADGCDPAHVATEARVPYTASYVFYE